MRRWSEASMRRAGYGVIAVTGALGVGALALGLRLGDLMSVADLAILISAFLVAGTLAMRAQPSNGAVWSLIGAALIGMTSSFGSHLAAWRTNTQSAATVPAMTDHPQIAIPPLHAAASSSHGLNRP